ncbi:MAG: hypothetical protein Kow0098_03740 [Ignavibacteriaceae bacterium]
MIKYSLSIIILFTCAAAAQSMMLDSTTVLSGDSLSGVINLEGYALAGLRLPDTLAGGNITLQDSWDGVNFKSVVAGDGTELQFTITINGAVKLSPWETWNLAPFIKLKTGLTGSAAAQTSDRIIYIEKIRLN